MDVTEAKMEDVEIHYLHSVGILNKSKNVFLFILRKETGRKEFAAVVEKDLSIGGKVRRI